MKKIIKSALAFMFIFVSIAMCACNDDILPNEYLRANKPNDWQQIVQNSTYYLDEPQLKQKVYEDGSIGEYFEQGYGNYPCIDGSTALIPLAWEAFWQLLPSYSMLNSDNYDAFADTFCRFSTTHEAYLNLIENKPVTRTIFIDNFPTEFIKAPDILLASAPSQQELDHAAANGVELIINPICFDSFVFITHKDNPVDSLTIEQVQGIYSGKITNWKELGGKNKKIAAYQREANSGSQTGMVQLVMKDIPLMDAPTKLTISAMDGLIDRIAKYENNSSSIGYTYKYYLNNMYKNKNVKILKINGIEPTDHNIKTRTYPFTAKGNAIIRANDIENIGGIFMQWLLSDEGQHCIAQAGYVPAHI